MQGVPLGTDSTVLELGCGDGFQLGLLCRRFARVSRLIQAMCLTGLAAALMLLLKHCIDSTFDLIVSNYVLNTLKTAGADWMGHCAFSSTEA